MTHTDAEMLTILAQMTVDQPDRPDHRGQDELDNETRLEQRAEIKAAARRGDFDGETSREWLARRRAE